MVVFPSPARRPGEQLSGTEDGVVVYGPAGLCRLSILANGSSVGVLALSSTAPAAPILPSRDYWYWAAGATPWPLSFELHYAPQAPLPPTDPIVHPQLVYTNPVTSHDLSGPGLHVWRVRRAELIQGVPTFEEVGYLTRAPDGGLAWYADAVPAGGYFALPAGTWLHLSRVDNTDLVVQATRAVPGAIS